MNAPAPRIDSAAIEVTEAHSRRVTASMLTYLAPLCARFTDDLAKVIAGAGRLGNPVAQFRFVERLRRARNPLIISVEIVTGKRGRCLIGIFNWSVFAPGSDHYTPTAGPRDQLAIIYSLIDGRRLDNIRSAPVMVVSRHALQRLCERAGARTPNDLLRATSAIWFAFDEARGDGEGPLPERISFADGVAILEAYQSTKWPRAVVVKAILPSDSFVPGIAGDGNTAAGQLLADAHYASAGGGNTSEGRAPWEPSP